MNPISCRALIPTFLAIALLPVHAFAADAPEHDHTHGQKPAATASTPDTPSAGKSADLMKRMSDLHERMMVAKTPAERQKLMDEGRKLMQEGMSMMQDMKSGQPMGMGMMGGAMGQNGAASGGGMGMGQCMDMHKAMSDRVDMMQMMMQTLMDQQAAGAVPAAKK